MSDSIGIAFIGAGAVARWHAAAVTACSQARLVGFYDIRHDRAEHASREYGGRTYSSIEELLSDPTVQAVTILSPVEHHIQHAFQALEANKHVLLEKPVASTLAEAQQLERRARESDKVCMPAHNYIYTPEMQRARRMISTGMLGDVVSAWIIYSLYHPRDVAAKYPGVLRQIMTHHFYSLLYLLGKPAYLAALSSETRTEKLDREDQVALILKMAGGALVNLFASFAADDQTSEPWTVTYKILGTKGGSLYSWRDAVIMAPGAGLSWRYLAYEESFLHEVDYFVHRCVLGREQPLSTMQNAVTAQMLIESAEEALCTGRTISF
jgi:predicted dehydrogenase